uniref:DUF1902 domain-containing protein n=1 Tax=Candidatus Kentrum sp. MB TaxID=2138164 RepID=A0A450XWC7_9GAMM|nr:MAG: hypothetical protein BECKMB1821G_GA0114241_11701 [Candidatus Kentron sp. MB]
MSPANLILHCYAERKDDLWQAFCLDLTIAAQGESFEEVRRKLAIMVKEYIDDAIEGEDQAYAKQLLTRRAPLRYWLKYNLYRFLHRSEGDATRFFSEVMPLLPIPGYNPA